MLGQVSMYAYFVDKVTRAEIDTFIGKGLVVEDAR